MSLAGAAAEIDRYNVGSPEILDVDDRIAGILNDRQLVVLSMDAPERRTSADD
jgi:hypothetical protein